MASGGMAPGGRGRAGGRAGTHWQTDSLDNILIYRSKVFIGIMSTYSARLPSQLLEDGYAARAAGPS